MAGVFDIIGPVMIGPSSSHTAGAVRIGKMARIILGEEPVQAIIDLHGSFAMTYRGHGTDKAIIAGLLGFETDDERIKDSLSIAEKEGLYFRIAPVDLCDAHPNTAVIYLTGKSGRSVRVTGASTGGGNILINSIDGYDVELRGSYHTLITIHNDKPGVIAMVTNILAKSEINVAFMRVSRQEKGAQALMIIEVDQPINGETIAEIQNNPSIKLALMVPPI